MKINLKSLSLGFLCLAVCALNGCLTDDGDKASAEEPGMYADETEGEPTPTAGTMLQNQSPECQKWAAKKKKNKKSPKFKAMAAKCGKAGGPAGKKAGKGMKNKKGKKGMKKGKKKGAPAASPAPVEDDMGDMPE